MAYYHPVLMDERMHGGQLLRPSKLTVQQELYSAGTASMALPEGEPTVGFRQWVRHRLPSGETVCYRVKSAPLDCGKEQKVQLTHGICTLGDELTPKETKLSGTAVDILAALMSYQQTARWQLGTVEIGGEHALEVNGESVQRAFFDAIDLFGDCYPEYDFSITPWTVNIRMLPNVPSCECRLSRNIAGVKIDYDESDFCTRIISPLLPGGELVAESAAHWGVVTRELNASEDADGAQAFLAAQRMLQRHSQPTIYAEVDALEISQQTGEALDSFAPGRVCRCALPDYGITVDKPIVAMRYDDLVGKPESVRLSLGRKVKDASQKLGALSSDADKLRRGVGGMGGRLKNTETTLIEQGDSLITLAAWSTTAAGALRDASIQIDGLNAQVRLKASQEEVNGLSSRVSQAEINIDGANASIALKASQISVDELGTRVTSAEINIDGARGEIALKVSKNGVISSINQTSEEIKIQAAKINLSGYVTASQLSSSLANIESGFADYMGTNTLRAIEATIVTKLTVPSAGLKVGTHDISAKSLTVVKDVSVSVSRGGNGYVVDVTLTKTTETLKYLGY